MIVNEVIENSFSSKNAEQYKLSILIGMDSFVFAVTDEHRHLQALKHWHFDKKTNTSNEYLETIFGNEPLLKRSYNRVVVGIKNMKYTLIPQKLYDENHRKQYLDNLIKITENDRILADQVSQEKVCTVFAGRESIIGFFTKKYPAVSFCHVSSALLTGLLQQPAANETSVLLADFQPDFMNLLFVQNGSVKLVNSYPTRSSNDQLYFILLIIEQFGLVQATQKVLYTGGIDFASSDFSQLKKYLPGLAPAPLDNRISVSEKFNRKIESFKYFDILSLAADN